MDTYGHLTISNTVKDVVEHEAFNGFGQFILPAERIYDGGMRLADVARLLPYHNYVTGEEAVETINTMIDHVHAGNRLFYDIYSDSDKQADPRKNNTGLFFSGESRAVRLPLSAPEVAFPMSGPSMRDSRWPSH